LPARAFQLHLVTEPRAQLIDLVTRALEGGVDLVQVRDKTASAAALIEQARALRQVATEHGAGLSINDRLDVALAVEADGVHLAGQSLPVGDAVRVAQRGGGGMLVGRSVHGLDEAVRAASEGAHYVTFGHVFPTTSHPGVPPRGLEELARIVQALDVPVIAIGGITANNLDDVLATGCAGIAVISAILAHPDARAATARLRQALDSSPYQPRFSLSLRRDPDAAHRQPASV
jgi:thiamine-phosphate pyrophosphorylase